MLPSIKETVKLDDMISSNKKSNFPVNNRRRSHRRVITKEDISCSQQSVLAAMDRFVKSVNNMSSTVLVPSKLKDMDASNVPAPLSSNNGLYHFYHMFNDVKNELLWGPGTGESAIMMSSSPGVNNSSGRSSPREPASLETMNDSLNSLVSRSSGTSGCSSLSSSASSSGSNNSSGSSSDSHETESSASDDMESFTTDSSVDEETNRLAATFRHHLQGLHAILTQLADSADYLSNRYTEEVESS